MMEVFSSICEGVSPKHCASLELTIICPRDEVKIKD